MSDVGVFEMPPCRRAAPIRKRRQSVSSRPPTELDRHLGGRLRSLRIARGVSREEMATMLGMTLQEVQEHERGTRRMAPHQLVEYAELLEVRLSRFFADVSARPPLALVVDP
jgi:ribosome-binding protein aMBF1 (putative translation factor)